MRKGYLSFWVRISILVSLVGLCTAAFSPSEAEASHFRFGHISWKPLTGTDIEFTITQAWRRTYFGSLNLGDPFSHIGFDFGDGTSVTPTFTVTALDPVNNWIVVQTTIAHTYPSPGNYTAFWLSGDRISRCSPPNAHINNPDGCFRVETIVNVGTGNSSPVSNLPPIVICPENGVCSFQIPATDPDRDPLTFRLSTSAEACGFRQPGEPGSGAPNAATIDPNTGVYRWDTRGATLTSNPGSCPNTLYSTQVMIEDGQTKVPLDFLIQLMPVTSMPPRFDNPTPDCGSTLNTNIGSTLTFTVQASDPVPAQIVTLNATGLPVGTTMTPSLPTTGNPVSSTFSWTPAPGQNGNYVINFTIRDDAGSQEERCSLTIIVAGENCSNGIDDDGDGLVDCADPDCACDPACAPSTETSCTNRIDDDCDGLVDCFDPDCGNCLPITRILPNKGGDIGTVTTIIYGVGFADGATVKLVRAGQPDILGDPVGVAEDGRSITTTFDCTGKQRGPWDVVVTNPDGTPGIFAEGFTIEEGKEPQLWANIIGRNQIRVGREATFSIVVGNAGNVDAHSVLIPVAAWVDEDKTPSESMLQDFVLIAQETKDIKLLSSSIKLINVVGSDPLTNIVSLSLTPTEEGCLSITGTAEETEEEEEEDLCEKMRKKVEESLKLAHKVAENVTDCEGRSDPLAIAQCKVRRCNELDLYRARLDLACQIWNGECNQIPNDCGISALNLVARELCGGIIPLFLRANVPLGNASADVCAVGSIDPNEKVGPAGFDFDDTPPEQLKRFIASKQSTGYIIFFENLETATAAAQEVLVTEQLDMNKLDLDTFSLGPIAFGDKEVVPPPGLSEFSTDVDLRPDKNLIVRIDAQLNKATGVVTWRFTSIDPDTGGLPDDPLAGFLPPNVNSPEGEGSVMFTVMPKEGLATGTEVRNKATIVFDVNPPIETNEWLNTIDNSKPESHVLPLAPTQESPEFTVEWTGDGDEGSGINDYTIFVSENGGPYTPWLTNTPDTLEIFTGQAGKTYAFYSVARDNTGNLEDAPTDADATTQIKSACQCADDNTPPTGCISGTVAKTAGRVLSGKHFAGKLVTLKRTSPRLPRVSKRVRTDNKGCYRATDLPDGTYQVKVSGCRGGGTKTVVVTGGGKVNGVDFVCR